MIGIFCRTFSILLAFIVGSIPTTIFQNSERNSEELIRSLSINLAKRESPFVEEDPQYTQIIESLRDGEFELWGHGCGNGFSDSYLTVGRKRASHSYDAFDTAQKARRAFNREIAYAKVIIDEPAETIREGKRVIRIFFKGETDEGAYFEIAWIGRHSDGYTSIAGPDEGTTLQFEQHILKRK